ncbi:MAG: PLP-dependent transferase, partial [Rhodoplanes sp.]
MNENSTPWKPRTLAAQALGRIEPQTKAIVPPVHVSTTYLRDPDNAYRAGLVYGRPDNETVRHAESVIAALEGGKAALLFGGNGGGHRGSDGASAAGTHPCLAGDVLGVPRLAHARGAAVRTFRRTG